MSSVHSDLLTYLWRAEIRYFGEAATPYLTHHIPEGHFQRFGRLLGAFVHPSKGMMSIRVYIDDKPVENQGVVTLVMNAIDEREESERFLRIVGVSNGRIILVPLGHYATRRYQDGAGSQGDRDG